MGACAHTPLRCLGPRGLRPATLRLAEQVWVGTPGEGEIKALPVGSRLAWAEHRLCLCCGPVPVGRAKQREGRRRTPSPPRWASPDRGCAPPVRVQRHCHRRLCPSARGRGQGPSPPGLARLAPRTACARVAAWSPSAIATDEQVAEPDWPYPREWV